MSERLFRDQLSKDVAMEGRATHLGRLVFTILSRLVGVCRVHIMWLFRSGSQDSEHSIPVNLSSTPQNDIKTAKSNLEKLRGYHDLAKARPLMHLVMHLVIEPFFIARAKIYQCCSHTCLCILLSGCLCDN